MEKWLRIISWLATIGSGLFLLSWISAAIPHGQSLSALGAAIAVVLLGLASAAWTKGKLRSGSRLTATAVARIIIAGIVCILSPYTLVALASSGSITNVQHHGHIFNWQVWLANFISGSATFFLYISLVEVSIVLHKNAPWKDVSESTQRLLPSWISAIASGLTGSIVISMHFADGPLMSISMGQAIVAAFAVAVLLAPFFRWFVKTSWDIGIVTIFNTTKWKASVYAVLDDIGYSPMIPDGDLATLKKHMTKCHLCQMADEYQDIMAQLEETSKLDQELSEIHGDEKCEACAKALAIGDSPDSGKTLVQGPADTTGSE